MFHHSIFELRHIYGDIFYQLYRRLNRISDPFHMYALPGILTSLYILYGQHLCFKVTITLDNIKSLRNALLYFL